MLAVSGSKINGIPCGGIQGGACVLYDKGRQSAGRWRREPENDGGDPLPAAGGLVQQILHYLSNHCVYLTHGGIHLAYQRRIFKSAAGAQCSDAFSVVHDLPVAVSVRFPGRRRGTIHGRICRLVGMTCGKYVL